MRILYLFLSVIFTTFSALEHLYTPNRNYQNNLNRYNSLDTYLKGLQTRSSLWKNLEAETLVHENYTSLAESTTSSGASTPTEQTLKQVECAYLPPRENVGLSRYVDMKPSDYVVAKSQGIHYFVNDIPHNILRLTDTHWTSFKSIWGSRAYCKITKVFSFWRQNTAHTEILKIHEATHPHEKSYVQAHNDIIKGPLTLRDWVVRGIVLASGAGLAYELYKRNFKS